MKKLCSIISFALMALAWPAGGVKAFGLSCHISIRQDTSHPDTVLYPEAMQVIATVINASATFNISAVANLYTPNAVVADEEPPFAWNGPTAGVQWINAIEKTCKDSKITKLRVNIRPVTMFQQTDESVYVVIPVDYRGRLPDDKQFEEKGSFTFVVRIVSGQWLIKSQAWMPKKAM